MKILGSDYDGTLNHNGIDEAKRDAIEKWRRAGNIFALISGRWATNVRELHLEQRFGCDYFIGSNGAVIMNSDGEVVSSDCCDLEMAVPLLKFLFEQGCPVGLVHSKEHFNVFPSEECCIGDNAYTLENMPELLYYNQISTWMPTYEEAAAITAKIRERFGERFNPLQNGNCIDIVRADVNKAKGLYRLMDIVGAQYEDVIAVGDNVNDRDMIKEFRSYAMANGVDEIRELADYITPGITELIEWEMSAES